MPAAGNVRLLHTARPGRLPLRSPAMASPSPGTGPPECARRPAPSLSLRACRRSAANHQACRGAGGSGGSRRAARAAMEDVCAKFVSQKISKTRWRPLPAAALQPPDLFATGSWDNEVASGRVRRRGAVCPSRRGVGRAAAPPAPLAAAWRGAARPELAVRASRPDAPSTVPCSRPEGTGRPPRCSTGLSRRASASLRPAVTSPGAVHGLQPTASPGCSEKAVTSVVQYLQKHFRVKLVIFPCRITGSPFGLLETLEM